MGPAIGRDRALFAAHTSAQPAERVQDDVDRGSILKERHVFHRVDLGDHTLVPVTAGHLVTRLQLALHREEDFYDLHYARRQIIALLDLINLVVKAGFQLMDRIVKART